jgi:guanylate kinase
VTKGPLIILSGPSGSGKSTVVERLLQEGGLQLRRSVTATTRAPREGERDGAHYHFWPRERFERERDAGALLEWADVFGALYGTPRSEVEPHREHGQGVVLVIDVQGAAQVRARCPDAVSIFLLPPSRQELERRLRERGTDGEAAIRRRLEGALRELARTGEYDFWVVNRDLGRAVAELHEIIGRQFGGERDAG